MCGFYDDSQKIKKGDSAIYLGNTITVVSAKHIKENRTMDITYTIDTEIQTKEYCTNIPYQTCGFGFELLERQTK